MLAPALTPRPPWWVGAARATRMLGLVALLPGTRTTAWAPVACCLAGFNLVAAASRTACIVARPAPLFRPAIRGPGSIRLTAVIGRCLSEEELAAARAGRRLRRAKSESTESSEFDSEVRETGKAAAVPRGGGSRSSFSSPDAAAASTGPEAGAGAPGYGAGTAVAVQAE